MPMNPCRHFLVSGHVQGVFFRSSTESVARKLGLTGWVRNRPDGRVELIACGTDSKLKELEQWLWQGPPRARVTKVEVREVAHEPFSCFDVSI